MAAEPCGQKPMSLVCTKCKASWDTCDHPAHNNALVAWRKHVRECAVVPVEGKSYAERAQGKLFP